MKESYDYYGNDHGKQTLLLFQMFLRKKKKRVQIGGCKRESKDCQLSWQEAGHLARPVSSLITLPIYLYFHFLGLMNCL